MAKWETFLLFVSSFCAVPHSSGLRAEYERVIIQTTGGLVEGERRSPLENSNKFWYYFGGISIDSSTEGRFNPPIIKLQGDILNVSQTGAKTDCVSMEIYTPKFPDNTEILPVVVTVNGSELNTESFHDSANIESLLAKNVIVVTIYYSLDNCESLSSLLEEQRDAVQWIKDNIGNFDGNPANITVFGHSEELIFKEQENQHQESDRKRRSILDWLVEGIENLLGLNTEYDFIIIGGGSAGSVLANRLSEIGTWKVLLLEAGGTENFITDVPVLAEYLQLTPLDWQYKTEPQEGACLGMNNRNSRWTRGKVLGGSSVLNYLLYFRGNKKDYDNWEALGNTGWSYNDVLPYFLKSEDNKNSSLSSTSYHSTRGYLTVSESSYETRLLRAFIAAGKELGYENRDNNGEFQTGFMKAQGTLRDGSRCSAAKAFLDPIKLRSNLHISTGSLVTKILIDPENKTAYGVELQNGLLQQRITAKKEIILSAGSINSPQLLMLSGVGPKEDLEKLNISVIQDLKVGHNLQDHVVFGGQVYLINTTDGINILKLLTPDSTLGYTLFGTGPLTLLGGIEGSAFINTKYVNASEDYPDIQLLFGPASLISDLGQLKRGHGLTDDFYDKTFKPYENQNCWSIYTVLMRPKSRGQITLRSTSPFDYPSINPKYFQDESDLKTLIEGVKTAHSLSKTLPLKSFGSTLIEYPDCANFTRYSDSYWECMIRFYTQTIYHFSGTCKMGPQSDTDAVVDPEMKVYGIHNLRVIDASIMTKIVSGNINAPIIMMAEKGADIIKKFWQNKTQAV